MDPETIDRISASRGRLSRLVAAASDEDLARPLDDGSGWTVSATLAHLALWDQRAVVLLRRWEREGIGPSHDDFDAINDALLPQWLALPPRAAADLALQAAEAADRAVASLTAEQLAAIAAAGGPIRPDRSAHRGDHLDAIERTLGSG
jgi:hypothetical protein